MEKLFKTTFLIALIVAPLLSEAQKRLRREESFFGFHFDFHATENDKELGKFFDEGLLDTFLSKTKPDYIQIDSKGHPGYSSYPTKVGYSVGSFVNDPIRIWRDVTEKHNIPLYVHYSGLWDDKAISENPEWARINADGSIDSTKAAYFSGYSSEILIPQLKELIDLYDIDGAWVDGDCWSTAPDYSPEVVDGFLTETQLEEVPRDPADGNYQKWLDYNRSSFREYLKNYVDELHRHDPDFQIASNWAYSSMMPERVDVDVDFLSGDVSGQNGVYSAAFQARCLALQGKPWDLMAWGFVPIDFMGGIHSPKSLVQLKQEAAEVMAMGGGFQVYFQQNRDGSFKTLDTEAIADLAEFCRERQPFSQQTEIVPQVGMWYSLEGWKKNNSGVYGWSSDMEGIMNVLLDGQHSVEILMDHHLKERMQQYPLIVVPEWDSFDPDLKDQLLDYVREGGNVFVIGAKAVKEFEIPLAVDFVQKDSLTQLNIGGRDFGGIAGLRTRWQPVKPNSEAEIIGKVYRQTDYRYATEYPVATVSAFGKGKIAGLYMDMSVAYNTYRNPIFNNIVNQIIEKLVPEATVKIDGSNQVHVVLGKKEGNTLVHLINSSGSHFNRNVLSYNEVFSTPALTMVMKAQNKPTAIMLQPSGQKLDFDYRDNKIEVVVPPVDIHTIIEVIH